MEQTEETAGSRAFAAAQRDVERLLAEDATPWLIVSAVQRRLPSLHREELEQLRQQLRDKESARQAALGVIKRQNEREERSQSELEQLRERPVNQAVASSELVTKLGKAEAELERLTGLMGQYADRAIENGTRADAAEAALERVRKLAGSMQAFSSVTGIGARDMVLSALKGES